MSSAVFTTICWSSLLSYIIDSSKYLCIYTHAVWYDTHALPFYCVNKKAASADRTARRQFQATGQPVSQTQASDVMTSRCRTMRQSMFNAGASNAGRSVCVQISMERSYPMPIYWYHSKGNWMRYNIAAVSFYIMKLCSRLFVLYCRNCPKDDKLRYFIPILRKLGTAQNLGWWLVGKPVSRSC